MSYLGARNAISLGVSYQATLGGPNLLNKLSPSLLLNFTNTSTLDPRITFTRSTTATFTGSNGLIQTAAINAPRFDYNPTTLASLGLLIEEQRTNLVTYSEQFQTTWTNIDSTEQTNVIVSPAGTLTGDKIVENSGSVTPFLSQSVSVTSGTAYTFSVYGKEDPTSAKRYLMLLLPSAQFGANIRVSVNLATGASATVGSPTATSVTAVGNGWYRISVTASATSTGSSAVQVRLTNDPNAGIVAYTGNGTSGIYIWGAQLEVGTFPTSYIPTVASQVTRAADVARISGANFTSFYNASEGTVYFESQTAQGTGTYPYSLFGASTQNRIFATYSSNARIESGVRVSNVFEALVATPTNSAPLNTFGKGATAYKVNDFGFSWNGAAALTDTSTNLPSVLQLDIGNNGGLAGNFLNGTIRQIAYYPRRLSNAELQGITR
jgi:hypothetical protein